MPVRREVADHALLQQLPTYVYRGGTYHRVDPAVTTRTLPLEDRYLVYNAP
jgi:hypothetical protein